MFLYDDTKYDICISLATNWTKGVWASETNSRAGRSVRTAGHVPAIADTIDLLAIALNSGLRCISKKQHQKMCELVGTSKLNVLIVCNHSGFFSAFDDFLKNNQSPNRPSINNRCVLNQLSEQTARFNYTYEHIPQDKTLTMLSTWADRLLLGASVFEGVGRFRPSLVSTSH